MAIQILPLQGKTESRDKVQSKLEGIYIFRKSLELTGTKGLGRENGASSHHFFCVANLDML